MTTTTFQMLVGGQSVPAVSGASYTSLNPATGEAWSTLPDGDAADVDHAVRVADAAFRSTEWRRQRPRQTPPAPW